MYFIVIRIKYGCNVLHFAVKKRIIKKTCKIDICNFLCGFCQTFLGEGKFPSVTAPITGTGRTSHPVCWLQRAVKKKKKRDKKNPVGHHTNTYTPFCVDVNWKFPATRSKKYIFNYASVIKFKIQCFLFLKIHKALWRNAFRRKRLLNLTTFKGSSVTTFLFICCAFAVRLIWLSQILKSQINLTSNLFFIWSMNHTVPLNFSEPRS